MKTSQTCTPVESCFSVVALRFIEMVSWRQLYLCQYILTQTNDTNMKIYLFTLLCFVAYLPANAKDKSTDKKENMNNYKKTSPFGTRRSPKKTQRSSIKSCMRPGLIFPHLPAPPLDLKA